MYFVDLKTMEQVYQMIKEYIHFYNHSCFQEKWNGLSSMGISRKGRKWIYSSFIVQLREQCALILFLLPCISP
ncbi:IS3 family transposase [Saccharococcus caldoxylosilyticus]|uniref:IS3 family transposase n=1 Tax=Saccharococcus caldoxylosilyticus TaxID=81408 RepID=UPI0039647D2F